MADEEKVEQEEVKNESSAADEKTEQKQGKDNSNMIPYDRFQQVIEEKNQYKNELEKLKDQLADMEDPEEIKKQYESKLDELENKTVESRKEFAIKTAALKEGVRKEALDDFVKVADKSKLENKDDEITGVDELIADMKENKTYFFGNDDEKQNVGRNTNPGGEENPTEEEERQKLEKYFGIKN